MKGINLYDLIGQVIAWTIAIVVSAACVGIVLGWIFVCTKIVKYAWSV